ncbi:MAG: FAD-binding oxidoreductase [Ignavibacteriae bacterium]|nr:FAD-binding oxidoreductase [Ignavibacteriota bacterium]
MKTFDVIIIGAGSIGVPMSFYLAKKGLKVAVLEKLASEGRGQNRAAIGGIRATHSDPAKIKICQISIELLKRMKEEFGKEIDWITGGYLFPVYDERTEKALKKLLIKQKEFNLNIDWIDAEKVDKLVPGINKTELRGGTFSPEDGSASPLKVAGAYLSLARNEGAEFYFNEEVISFETENSKIISVTTSKDKYSGGIIINAAGGDAREIGLLTGVNIPVIPDSHEAGITEPVKPFFKPMVVDIRPDTQSANYYFYQNKEGQVVFCITPKPPIVGKDTDSTSEFLPLVIKRMLNLYPRLRNLRVRRTWRGLYPMTPDGFPIVGFTKEIENLFLAAGMCGQGFMLGPGLGLITSEIIADGNRRYDFITEQLTLYRNFSGTEMLK